MKLTRVDIYNLALGNIKIAQRVASLDDKAVRNFMLSQNYDLALSSLLAAHEWSFATINAKLAKIESIQEALPTMAYAHSWVYPEDCEKVLRIGSFHTVFDFQHSHSWDIVHSKHGRAIRTQHDHAAIKYITNDIPEARFPPLFVEALAWTLASKITRSESASDTDSDYRMQQARTYLDAAIKTDVMEMGPVIPRDGDALEFRCGYRDF